MIKYITSLINPPRKRVERMKKKFEIVEEYPHITIKMQRGFFFVLVRCLIVGQAEVRRSSDGRTKISKKNVEWMWVMHREAARMQEESRVNNSR